MTARAVGRELFKAAQRGVREASLWAGGSEASIGTGTTLPKAYDLLQPRTRTSLQKALRYCDTNPPPFASSSSPSSPSPSPSHSSFTSFEALAREAFYKTSAIAKIPTWTVDPDRLDDLRGNSVHEESVPVTVPGYGRKLWAGQEDVAQISQEEQAKDDDEIDAEEEVDAEQARIERLQKLSRKARHPDGRNGINLQRSALRRAKGHQAIPRTLDERRGRETMPGF